MNPGPRQHRAVAAYAVLAMSPHLYSLLNFGTYPRLGLSRWEGAATALCILAMAMGAAVLYLGRHGRELWGLLAAAVVAETGVRIAGFAQTSIFTGPFAVVLLVNALPRAVMLWGTSAVLWQRWASAVIVRPAPLQALAANAPPATLQYAPPDRDFSAGAFPRNFAVAWSLATILSASWNVIYVLLSGGPGGGRGIARPAVGNILTARHLAELCFGCAGPVAVLLVASAPGPRAARHIAGTFVAAAIVGVLPRLYDSLDRGSWVHGTVPLAAIALATTFAAPAFAWLAFGGKDGEATAS